MSILDQRNLGMSMKIERSSLDQVRMRFEVNKKKKEEKTKEYDIEERLKEIKEEVCALPCFLFCELCYCLWYLCNTCTTFVHYISYGKILCQQYFQSTMLVCLFYVHSWFMLLFRERFFNSEVWIPYLFSALLVLLSDCVQQMSPSFFTVGRIIVRISIVGQIFIVFSTWKPKYDIWYNNII